MKQGIISNFFFTGF